jgi:hypothetical protein
MNLTFSVWERLADGRPNRRFHKVRYTAALRLGVVPEAANGRLEIRFSGDLAPDVEAHPGNTAFEGSLQIANISFSDVVVIAKGRSDSRYDLVTFWPVSQHPDAHQSYTDPLVDTAMDGTPFDVEIVATTMHAAFLANAGASPATLMKRIYETENFVLKDAAERYGRLLDESIEREREVEAELVQERSARQKAEADADESKNELERLRQEAVRVAPPGTVVRPSNVAVLERVEEGRRGRDNQRAILLHMSDGTVRANNWPNGYQARLSYARRLEGRRVKTDVWGSYPWQEWFQNIYAVDE